MSKLKIGQRQTRQRAIIHDIIMQSERPLTIANLVSLAQEQQPKSVRRQYTARSTRCSKPMKFRRCKCRGVKRSTKKRTCTITTTSNAMNAARSTICPDAPASIFRNSYRPVSDSQRMNSHSMASALSVRDGAPHGCACRCAASGCAHALKSKAPNRRRSHS
jgi:ribosomal protein L24